MNTEDLANRIRNHVVDMTHTSHASHVASAMSIADIIAVLYGSVLHYSAGTPRDLGRDRFVLSKGHAGTALYAALAEEGFFPLRELEDYYQNGSKLSGHISHKGVPGVEVSTGSLGHGVCIACGMAMAAKLDHALHHIYALVGDGECEEGAVWEMALFASHNRLANFTVIVDNNRYQAMGTCENVIGMDGLAQKWGAFGFHVVECDGHDHEALKKAFGTRCDAKPVCVVAHTVKGKGVSFMENNLLWHYRDPQGEFYEQAKAELGGRKDA